MRGKITKAAVDKLRRGGPRQFEHRLAKIQTDLAVLKGMVAVNLAMTASLIVKAFT